MLLRVKSESDWTLRNGGMGAEIEQRLARLEERLDEASARAMVSEGLLAAVVRHLPQVAAVIADFELHQDYLEAASLNSTGATDAWIAKLQAARTVMLFRVKTPPDPPSDPQISKP